MNREELDEYWQEIANVPGVHRGALRAAVTAERAASDERIALLSRAVDTQREIIEQLRGQVKADAEVLAAAQAVTDAWNELAAASLTEELVGALNALSAAVAELRKVQ